MEDEPEPGTVLKSYKWDNDNRMTEAVVGNEHVYFAYDAAGERTLKYSEHAETVYVDRMYQVEPVKEPNLYTKHIFVGETRLVSRVGDEGQAYGGQNGEIYYYHPDHLGNTTWVTDNAGAEYEHIEYTPYGESWVDEGRDSLNRINYLFTSKELDAETGLYYFGARYLDPKTSRWMSADPAMGEYLPAAGKGADGLPGMGGVFNAVNLVTYHYAGNNPLKYVDPNGKENESILKKSFCSFLKKIGLEWLKTVSPKKLIKEIEKIALDPKYIDQHSCYRTALPVIKNLGYDIKPISTSGATALFERLNQLSLIEGSGVIKVSREQAMEYANLGLLVLASSPKNDKIDCGHICFVAPETSRTKPIRSDGTVDSRRPILVGGGLSAEQAAQSIYRSEKWIVGSRPVEYFLYLKRE